MMTDCHVVLSLVVDSQSSPDFCLSVHMKSNERYFFLCASTCIEIIITTEVHYATSLAHFMAGHIDTREVSRS